MSKPKYPGPELVLFLLTLLLLTCIGLAFYTWGVGDKVAHWLQPSSKTPAQKAKPVQVSKEETQSFAVKELPARLYVENDVGPIYIKSSAQKKVIIHAQVQAWGSNLSTAREALEEVKLNFQQNEKGAISAIVHIQRRLPGTQTPSTTLNLLVPTPCVLELYNGVGDLKLENLEGSFYIQSQVGNVQIIHPHLTWPSKLELKTGDVHLVLSPEVPLALNLQTRLGRITSVSDLPIESTPEKLDAGARLRGFIQKASAPKLTILVNAGSIIIQKEH